MHKQTGVDLMGSTGGQDDASVTEATGAGEAVGAAAETALQTGEGSGSGSGATNRVTQAHAQLLNMVGGVSVVTTVARLQRTKVNRDDWLAEGVAEIDQSENATFASRSSLLINKFTPGVTAVAQKFLTGSPMGRQLFVDGEWVTVQGYILCPSKCNPLPSAG